MRRHARRLACLLAAALLALSGAAASAHAWSPGERAAAIRCDRGNVTGCLERAALHHKVPYLLLRKIAWCESRLQPRAVNALSVGGEHASGLMQFLPSTFRSTPYARRPILSAKWNALAGAWLLRVQGTGPWTASRHCWAG